MNHGGIMPKLFNKYNLLILLLVCLVLPACGDAPLELKDNLADVFGVAVSPQNGNLAIKLLSRKYRGIFIADPKGRVLKWVCRSTKKSSCGDPAYSPDGKQLAFYMAGEGGRGNIFILDLSTHRLRRLTQSPYFDFVPVFSPDGARLFFVRHKSVAGHESVLFYNGDIYYIDLATGKEHQLTHQNFEGLKYISISPDGRKILFQNYGMVRQGHSIWWLDVDHPDRLIPASPDLSAFARNPKGQTLDYPSDAWFVVIERPKLSRDGRYMAFTWLNPEKKHDEWYQVYVTDLQTAKTRQLTGVGEAAFTKKSSLSKGGFSKAISPDGQWIWFSSFRGAYDDAPGSIRQTKVYRINRDGTGLNRLILDFSAMEGQQPLIDARALAEKN